MVVIKGKWSNGQLSDVLRKNKRVPPDTRLTRKQIAEQNRKNIENRKSFGG
jgi:hypothetical protein